MMDLINIAILWEFRESWNCKGHVPSPFQLPYPSHHPGFATSGKEVHGQQAIYRHPYQLPPFWYFTNKIVCFIIKVWLMYRLTPEMTFRTYCTTTIQLFRTKQIVYVKNGVIITYKYIIIVISNCFVWERYL
jgi:hypothetical protein